jgi:two-component system response regulator AtoC
MALNRSGKILIIDDDEAILKLLQFNLENLGHTVITANNGEKGLSLICNEEFDLVFLDIMMPGTNGIEILKNIRHQKPHLSVIMMTALKSISPAITAMKLGAFDYLTKPNDISDENRLSVVVRNAISVTHSAKEIESLRGQFLNDFRFENIIGDSPPMQHVFSQIEKVADSSATVLIQGENGTGKELVAKAIHFNSSRSQGPFVDFNCAAIPENLIESELFGHEKGSFTGALTRKIGKFEQSHNGTLFLDEVGDMPMSTQAKILRVLQERSFERVGGSEKIHVDVRIVAATNKNLEEAVKQEQFRQDLFYRLTVFPIKLPSLRERLKDIYALTIHFLKKYAQESGKELKKISPGTLAALKLYRWPGNVRELENVIQRAAILAPRGEKTLKIDYLPMEIAKVTVGEFTLDDNELVESKDTKPVRPLAQVERDALQYALNVADGNVALAAEMLNIGRATMYRKVEKYQLQIKDTTI